MTDRTLSKTLLASILTVWLAAPGAAAPQERKRERAPTPVSPAGAQSAEGAAVPPPVEEDYRVYTEAPRLLLSRQRLRLLRRERERQSLRWRQFELLMAGKAQMAEPGLAAALYGQVTEKPEPCREATTWALGTTSDLRQMALVLDWCQQSMSESQSTRLADKVKAGLAKAERATDLATLRARALAAVAISGTDPALGEQHLRPLIQKWWRGEVVPLLRRGGILPRSDTYALFEMLHAVRDNLNIELREDAAAYFKELPIFHILSYYPAPYPAAENDFRIPFYTGNGDPDLRLATMSRAAEFAMVAYDNNALESQYLQSWLIQDRYLMRGTLGILYELLWANPYQPGLSVYHLPSIFHDRRTGRLFVRSSWDEDATLLCFNEGQLQLFEDGKRSTLTMTITDEPMRIGDTFIVLGKSTMRLALEADSPQNYYIVGLKAARKYDIEVDDEELREDQADAGGILHLSFAAIGKAGVRIREAPVAPLP